MWSTNPGAVTGESRIKYYFDGEDTPRLDMTINNLFDTNTPWPFDSPLCFLDDDIDWRGLNVRRFGILYYPFSFRKRLKITIDGDFNALVGVPYGAAWYQYTYLTYPSPDGVDTWASDPNVEDNVIVRDQWDNVGDDPKDDTGNILHSTTVSIGSGQTVNVLNLNGAGSICSIKMDVSPYNFDTFYNTYIRIYWDGSVTPAVDLPLGYLFGGGGKDYSNINDLVWQKSLTTLMFGYDATLGTFYTYWPMPYWSNAKIDIYNGAGSAISSLNVDVEYKPLAVIDYPKEKSGYFYAKRTIDNDEGDELYTIAFEEKGKGHLVGLTFYTYGFAMDGDEFTYIDGSRTPQMHGDGTEDDHNQGFGGTDYQKPLWGGLLNGYQGTYRIYMNDCYIFNSHIRKSYEFTFDGGGANGGSSDCVGFYYKSDDSDNYKLRLTDEVDVGDSASEVSHNYSVTGQKWAGTLHSGYDGFERDYEYDICSDDGRAFDGSSKLDVSIDPANNGVRLRRRISRFSNNVQVADVYVDGRRVYEDRWGVAAPLGNVSYSRWWDIDFDIPAKYTVGKSNITVEIKYVDSPSRGQINEFYYWVYSYVQSETDTTAPGHVTGLVATASSEFNVNLSWNSVSDTSGIKYYEIIRSNSAVFSSYEVVAKSNKTSYSDGKVLPDSTYYYKVRAVDIYDNEGDYSNYSSASTLSHSYSSTATYLGSDWTTVGKWGGIYGSDGFVLFGYEFGDELGGYPSYVVGIDYGTLGSYYWGHDYDNYPKNIMCSPISFNTSRVGCRFTNSVDSMTVYVNDTEDHDIALNLCDFDTFVGGRQETVEILDLNNNVLVGAIMVEDFNDGMWLKYRINGSFKIRLTNLNSANAVISALMFESVNLAAGKTYSASSYLNASYSPDKAFDGNYASYWRSVGGEQSGGWLEVDFGSATSFNHVIIKQNYSITQSRGYKIQYYSGGQWIDAYDGDYLGVTEICAFNPVTSNKMRLLFTKEVSDAPAIYELKVYNTKFEE